MSTFFSSVRKPEFVNTFFPALIVSGIICFLLSVVSFLTTGGAENVLSLLAAAVGFTLLAGVSYGAMATNALGLLGQIPGYLFAIVVTVLILSVIQGVVFGLSNWAQWVRIAIGIAVALSILAIIHGDKKENTGSTLLGCITLVVLIIPLAVIGFFWGVHYLDANGIYLVVLGGMIMYLVLYLFL